MVAGNVLGVRALRGVGGPDDPGLDCPAPPPAPGAPREEGAGSAAGMEQASRADQTLSTKGVWSLPPAASSGAQEHPAT